jgi:ubiquinone/menaquinone biosynthesis C-methylase UbiE
MIQRQYDEIIASHYDSDAQSVIGASLDRAVQQLEQLETEDGERAVLRVLDVGLGTGRFLEKVRGYAADRMQPYGLDLSQKMLDIACARIPDLSAAVGDATNLDRHFSEIAFDMVATHFITGFVPISVLAPKIARKLETGGLWSFVGGTKAGFPALQEKVQGKLAKLLFRIKSLDVDDVVCNPADEGEVVDTLERNAFAVRACEVFCPPLDFPNLEAFLEFAYYGGWLTPFVERFGLHRARPALRAICNGLFFPVHDHHRVVIALAQKQ